MYKKNNTWIILHHTITKYKDLQAFFDIVQQQYTKNYMNSLIYTIQNTKNYMKNTEIFTILKNTEILLKFTIQNTKSII